jgi:hypothetical protein
MYSCFFIVMGESRDCAPIERTLDVTTMMKEGGINDEGVF